MIVLFISYARHAKYWIIMTIIIIIIIIVCGTIRN